MDSYSWGAAGVPHMEGHASWVEAYYPAGLKVGSLPPLYEWFLRHRRSSSSNASSSDAFPPHGQHHKVAAAKSVEEL